MFSTSTILSPELEHLVEEARKARTRAYAPYSNFKVGAAVQSIAGSIFSAPNVENASYGATICAERNAINHMVAAGETRLLRLAVYTEAPELTMPCGICRQVIAEFGIDVIVAVAGPSGARATTLGELLPSPFRFSPNGTPA